MSNPFLKNNDAIVSIITQRINGVQKHLKAEKADIPVNGKLLKPSLLLKLYQHSLDTRAAVKAGHAAYQGALKDRTAAEADRLAADESLKAWVLARFGAGSVEASEFGFEARRTPVVSVEKRAAAHAQSKATRQARGTVGRKKKLQIKGVVPTSTAPAAPATPATSASPQTLVALPALLTSAPPVTASVTPSAQIAAGPVATPPPTVAPVVPVVTPAPAVVTPTPPVVTAPVAPAAAPQVAHS